MRNINIGDAVCLIEVWKDATTGLLTPSQLPDCRMYGFCRDIGSNGILVTSELDDAEEVAIPFPSLITSGMKEGDHIVMHADDASELYPMKAEEAKL